MGIDDKIEKTLKIALKDNVIGEGDIVESKTVIAWLIGGRKEAEKISKKAVRNLVKGGFVEGNKLIGANKKDIGIWFVLAVCGAKGFIKQVESKKK